MKNKERDKAKEIVEEFLNDGDVFFDDYYEGDTIRYSKRCAEICVDRILLALEPTVYGDIYNFYVKVREEIPSLSPKDFI